MIEFASIGGPISNAGIASACSALSTKAPELWSIISVETSGCGFLPDRRPKILFERHIFHRLTAGKYDADDPDISQPTAGGYGRGGAHQYDRLAAAMVLNRSAALQSASWGLGQIMGENFSSAGFADIEGMVSAMVSSEDAQLSAMAAFLKSTHIDRPLLAHDWAGFARRYNGPDYAARNYDEQLQDNYNRYATGPLPDLSIRTVQVYLRYKGFPLGGVDGILGSNTISEIKSYQSAKKLPITGVIDDTLIASLSAP